MAHDLVCFSSRGLNGMTHMVSADNPAKTACGRRIKAAFAIYDRDTLSEPYCEICFRALKRKEQS